MTEFDRRRRQVKKVKPLFDIPLSEVRDLEVDIWSAERSEYGWRPTTGLLHGARTVGATSAIVFTLTNGKRIVFQADGPPAVVKAQLGPLVDRLAK